MQTTTVTARKDMKITYQGPEGIKSFRYGPNHHYVELEDPDGNTAHLPATDIMKIDCSSCDMSFFVKSNYGLRTCVYCSAPAEQLNKSWGKMQVAFIPEDESAFEPPPQVESIDGDAESKS